jgi:hypothetical protein
MQAMAALERVLALAEAEGYIRLFADEGVRRVANVVPAGNTPEPPTGVYRLGVATCQTPPKPWTPSPLA